MEASQAAGAQRLTERSGEHLVRLMHPLWMPVDLSESDQRIVEDYAERWAPSFPRFSLAELTAALEHLAKILVARVDVAKVQAELNLRRKRGAPADPLAVVASNIAPLLNYLHRYHNLGQVGAYSNRMRRRRQSPQTSARNCLTCQQVFQSEGSGNRICPKCQKKHPDEFSTNTVSVSIEETRIKGVWERNVVEFVTALRPDMDVSAGRRFYDRLMKAEPADAKLRKAAWRVHDAWRLGVLGAVSDYEAVRNMLGAMTEDEFKRYVDKCMSESE
jgi:hypothetical protein